MLGLREAGRTIFAHGESSLRGLGDRAMQDGGLASVFPDSWHGFHEVWVEVFFLRRLGRCSRRAFGDGGVSVLAVRTLPL